jgi:hypothetical protein
MGVEMKVKSGSLAASVLAAFALTVPAWAHHSFVAAYDTKAPFEIHGTINKVLLQNPHSWFIIDVKDASGKVEQWSFEAGTPSGMIRNGYKPGVIHSGVEVTIKGFHAKDAAKKEGMLNELIMPDGQVYGLFGPH